MKTKKAPEKKPAKEKPVLEKSAEKLAEKLADKLEKSDEEATEKPAEIPKSQESKSNNAKGDLEKKVKAEKEERTEKQPEAQTSYQNTDEKSYQQGYSSTPAISYVKTQVVEPAATPAQAYKQPAESKDAYVSHQAEQKQPTPSHLETKLRAVETAAQPTVSYARNATEKVYSPEKPVSSTPSVIDSLLSLNAVTEFSIPEISVTSPQADLAGMHNFVQAAQTVYNSHKSGQKISGADLRIINDIKSEIGYKGSCCDELVVQKYAERKADVRKAA